ncbi:unnamed protein product [Brugia timori]|uniref:Secreted protein n=2 Tax=Brugia TaxID=6278 RepID=A0A0R3Q5U5_9BILA|nr:unnamed protein product [Brugia timori]
MPFGLLMIWKVSVSIFVIAIVFVHHTAYMRKALFLLVTPNFVSEKLFCLAGFSLDIHSSWSSFMCLYMVMMIADVRCSKFIHNLNCLFCRVPFKFAWGK